MKILIIISCFIPISLNVYAQENAKQIARIDSLVSLIDGGKGITQIIICDTTAIWDTGYFTVYCDQFYTHNNKLVKAAFQIKTFPVPEKPVHKGIHFTYNAFYFHSDSLIKAIIKDSSNSLTPIDEYYFTSKNLSELDSLNLRDPQKSKRVNAYNRYGNNFLLRFKENRMD